MANYNSTSKVCCKCQQILSFDSFHKNASKVDGHATQCKECTRFYNSNHYRNNKAEHNAWGRADYAAKSEVYKARAAVWAAANPDKVSLYRVAWRIRNPEKIAELSRLDRLQNIDKRRASGMAWRKANPAKCAQHVRARQARLLQAMPGWADPDAILKFYEAAKTMERLTGEKWHVDHYYPLRGKLVCGLHVVENLQVIPASVNQAKSNRHPEEY